MANPDSDNPDRGRSGADQSGNSGDDTNGEWLRDQVGEDHNLSGSSTYRTLPDQPPEEEDDTGTRDAKERQSDR